MFKKWKQHRLQVQLAGARATEKEYMRIIEANNDGEGCPWWLLNRLIKLRAKIAEMSEKLSWIQA
jgi:hypothetical protein